MYWLTGFNVYITGPSKGEYMAAKRTGGVLNVTTIR